MRRIAPRRLDWPRMVIDLFDRGVPAQDISTAVDRSRTWVYALLSGACEEPKHCDGEAVLLLWAQTTGWPVADAPLRGQRREHMPRPERVKIADSATRSIGATPIR